MDDRAMDMARGAFLINCSFNVALRQIADHVPGSKQGKSLEEILLIREGYKSGG
jgi:hypothetical protein